MATFKIVHGRKGFHPEGTIEIRVYFYDGSSSYYSTGVSVRKDQFSGMSVVDHPEKAMLTSKITDKLKLMTDFDKELEYHGKVLTQRLLSDLFKGRASINRATTINSIVADWEVDVEGLEIGTARNRKHVRVWFDRACPDIPIKNMDFSIVKEFHRYMKASDEIGNWTIWRIHSALSGCLTQAVAAQLIPANPYVLFKNKKPPSRQVFLYPHEVTAIAKLDYVPGSVLGESRDAFLVACYLGLRFSDIADLQWSHFINFMGANVLRKTLIKGNKTYAREIVLRVDEIFKGKGIELIQQRKGTLGKVFPRMNRWAMDRSLKTIQKDAGIEAKLTCHVGRHTFGTLRAIECRDPYQVMRDMGHSNLETSMIYTHYAEKLVGKNRNDIQWEIKAGEAKVVVM